MLKVRARMLKCGAHMPKRECMWCVAFTEVLAGLGLKGVLLLCVLV